MSLMQKCQEVIVRVILRLVKCQTHPPPNEQSPTCILMSFIKDIWMLPETVVNNDHLPLCITVSYTLLVVSLCTICSSVSVQSFPAPKSVGFSAIDTCSSVSSILCGHWHRDQVPMMIITNVSSSYKAALRNAQAS